MKELQKYIENIVNDVNWSNDYLDNNPNVYEFRVNDYIQLKYKKIKKQKYFYLKYNAYEKYFFSCLDPAFEDELRKHYPEKLI